MKTTFIHLHSEDSSSNDAYTATSNYRHFANALDAFSSIPKFLRSRCTLHVRFCDMDVSSVSKEIEKAKGYFPILHEISIRL